MAERNLVFEALALRVRESPGGSRILCLMTAEAGLLDVFVFGGPKSKLRSLAAPWSAGRAFVYHDPVKDLSKLSDFEVRDSFSGLREGLRKIWCASLIGEFLQKTSGGGGDYPLVLSLALEALSCLEALPEDRADYPTLLFLWKMLGLLGLMPDPRGCASCGADLDPAGGLLYVPSAGGFVCPACARAESGRPQGWHEHGAIPLSPGAARWLARSVEWSFAQAGRVGLDGASLEGLRSLVFHLAQKAAEGPLSSLKSGLGII